MATTTSFTKSHRPRLAVFALTYADTTSAKMLQLPANATVIDWIVNVQTGFSGGTAELDLGISTDGDYFVDGLDVSSAGKASPTVLQPGHKTSAVTDIYANVGAGNTAGAVQVTLMYVLDVDRRF